MNHNCKFNSQLSAYLDGELTHDQMEDVRSHVITCNTCRRHLEEFQRTEKMVLSIPEIEPSQTFEAAFWKKIADSEKPKTRVPVFRFLRFRLASLAAVSLTAAIAFWGLVIWNPVSSSPDPDQIVVAENLELFQNLQEIHHLELLENWETIVNMDESS